MILLLKIDKKFVKIEVNQY